MSKKIQDNIQPDEPGLWTETANATVVAFADRDDYDTNYYLNFHKGLMPTYGGETFKTIEELEAAMRRVQPDMRRWRTKWEE